MTNEQKLELLDVMIKAANVMKKCSNILAEVTGKENYLFNGLSPSKLSYQDAFRGVVEELETEIAKTSGNFGDDTTPDYSIPTKTFVVGGEYDAWIAYADGEHSSVVTLLGRKGDVLYFRRGNEVIRGEVEIENHDVYGDVECVTLHWLGSNGLYYYWSTISSEDFVRMSPNEADKKGIKPIFLENMCPI